MCSCNRAETCACGARCALLAITTGIRYLTPVHVTGSGPDRRDHRLLVSHPKNTEIHNLYYVESQVFTPNIACLVRAEDRTQQHLEHRLKKKRRSAHVDV